MMLFIPNKHLNQLMRDSIQTLAKDARHANYANITMRVDGRDFVYQADWLKHIQFPKHELQVAARVESESDKPKDEGSNAADIQPK